MGGPIVIASVGRDGSHHRSANAGRIRATLVAVLVAAALLLPVAAEAVSYPDSMASTGDSITRAYNTGFFPYTDNTAGSWSTGTNTTVSSHYRRLLALNPAIQGKNYNYARSGARMVDLNGQLTAVASRHVDYVTVLMGGNDVCTSSPATMTSVADFSSQFTLAMDAFTRSSPNTRVFVASIPRVLRLWSTLKNNGTARFVWALFGVCQSMLKNPLSTTAADVARRTAVDEREQAFNGVLESVCASHPHCLFDGNATFNYAFTTADISTRDYFHPSLTGQKNLAAGTWAVGFWGP
jgi:lysophospholipase L1-like esterase